MKDLLDLFKDIKVHKAIILCLAAFSILLPGILFLYEFEPVIFSGDVFKLQLIAAAMSFGLLLILLLCFSVYFLEQVEKQLVLSEKTIWLSLLFASILCSAELFLMSFIKIWVGNGFKASAAISICLGFDLLLLLDSSRDYRGRIKKLKSS